MFWGSWIALAALAWVKLDPAHFTVLLIGSYAMCFMAAPFVRCTHCRCLVALRFISPIKQLRLLVGYKIPCPKCSEHIS